MLWFLNKWNYGDAFMEQIEFHGNDFCEKLKTRSFDRMQHVSTEISFNQINIIP